jgi:prepilin-type processing-associated H-X9-DG protein
MFTVGTQMNTMMFDGHITHTKNMAAMAYTESFYVDTKL